MFFERRREKPHVPDLPDFQRHTIAVPYGRFDLQHKESTMHGTTKYITLEDAKKAMTAAEAEARKNSWNVAIAIVDAGGNLILFAKIDDTQLGSVNIAIGKARTAVNFKRPTKALEDMIAGGRQVFLAVEGITPLQGGLPVMADGKLIGAVGVSGVLSSQDEQVAQAAVTVLQG
jgi:uncharacterized protein GlcG (DUF336 family)